MLKALQLFEHGPIYVVLKTEVLPTNHLLYMYRLLGSTSTLKDLAGKSSLDHLKHSYISILKYESRFRIPCPGVATTNRLVVHAVTISRK
ncbi:hypothetical protein BDV96DRAFT_591196 [Lophiotrema nucula]|uniref:Uncharacterized protein n=1 Tax=Lophiotrema nucula TaxID=690887 RepID=A0A6A5YGQ7_9PLEO|nr:hypothetical protein BDV96DRAFT_591196 [Lophiotrema nucula]